MIYRHFIFFYYGWHVARLPGHNTRHHVLSDCLKIQTIELIDVTARFWLSSLFCTNYYLLFWNLKVPVLFLPKWPGIFHMKAPPSCGYLLWMLLFSHLGSRLLDRSCSDYLCSSFLFPWQFLKRTIMSVKHNFRYCWIPLEISLSLTPHFCLCLMKTLLCVCMLFVHAYVCLW